ncbi:MAG: hypothetical protein ACR2M4_07030 [Actinomycetota bacterium]
MSPISEHARKPFHGGWAITSAVLAVTLLPALPARAQWIPCLGDPTISGEPPTPIPLPTIPELGAKNGKLRATVLLTDEQQRFTFKTPPGAAPSDTNVIKCAPQYVRVFKGLDAVPPYPKKTGDYPDPMPRIHHRREV